MTIEATLRARPITSTETVPPPSGSYLLAKHRHEGGGESSTLYRAGTENPIAWIARDLEEVDGQGPRHFFVEDHPDGHAYLFTLTHQGHGMVALRMDTGERRGMVFPFPLQWECVQIGPGGEALAVVYPGHGVKVYDFRQPFSTPWPVLLDVAEAVGIGEWLNHGRLYLELTLKPKSCLGGRVRMEFSAAERKARKRWGAEPERVEEVDADGVVWAPAPTEPIPVEQDGIDDPELEDDERAY